MDKPSTKFCHSRVRLPTHSSKLLRSTSTIKVDFKQVTREITKMIFFMREFTVFDIQEHLESVFKNGYYLENRKRPETNPGYRRIQEIRKILERYFLVI